jgi:hypothetical protein
MIRLLAALCLFALATLVLANDVQSRVIATNSSLATIRVPNDHFLVIRNFTQDGGMVRGTVTVTLDDQPLSPTTVLAAAITSSSNPPETVNRIVVAGPANVDITCGDGTTCFVTYLKDAE